MTRLKSELAKAESEVIALKMSSGAVSSATGPLEARIRDLERQGETRIAELVKLKATVKTYEESAAGSQARASSSALSAKAEISALRAQSDEQTRLIQSLRSELASSNQRLARQSQHFRDELRRFGSLGLQQSSDQAGRESSQKKPSLAERIAQPRAPHMPAIGQSVNGAANEAIGAAAAQLGSGQGAAVVANAAAGGSGVLASAGEEGTSTAAASGKVSYLKAVHGSGDGSQPGSANDAAASSVHANAGANANEPKRSRLLDRIASVDKQ